MTGTSSWSAEKTRHTDGVPAENPPSRRESGSGSGVWPGAGLALMLAVLAHRIIAWHIPMVDGIWVACLIGLLLRNAGWAPWWAEAGLRWAARWITAAAVVGLLVQVVMAQSVAGSEAVETVRPVVRMLATTAMVAVAAQVDVRRLSARRGQVLAAGALVGALALAVGLPVLLEL